MADSPYVLDITAEDFVTEVMERSQQTPVLVDFWAQWCGPCKSLAPILEQLTESFNGALVLAKVDTDAEQNQALVAQAGIRSLPTVMLFIGGQPVDQFMGALPEGEIRAFLSKHGVEAAAAVEEQAPEDPLTAAMALHEAGDSAAALAVLTQAQAQDPSNADLLLAIGNVSLSLGDLATVENVLKHLPEDKKDSAQAKRLSGLIRFSQADEPSLSLSELEQQQQNGTIDSAGRYQLGVKYAVRGELESALEAFLGLMMRDRAYGDDAGKQSLLALFDVLGEDPLCTKYRRRMFSLLH